MFCACIITTHVTVHVCGWMNLSINQIYNTFTSLSSPEEVLSTNYAVWWSGDGSKLLYASFNDSMVKEFSFPIYGPFEDVYTTITDIPYPKVAGHVTPTVCHVTSNDAYTGWDGQSHSGATCHWRWFSSESYASDSAFFHRCHVSVAILYVLCWLSRYVFQFVLLYCTWSGVW